MLTAALRKITDRMRRSLLKGAAMPVFMLAAFMMLTLQGCGSGPEFRIDGFVDGLGTQNLKVVYYADGAFQQVSAPAVDGRFSMIGRTGEPALVWIYNNAGTLVGRLVVDGGDHVEASFSISNPLEFKAKGNKESELLAEFIRDNATLIAKVNHVSQSGGSGRAAGSSTASAADISRLNKAVENFVDDHSSNAAAAAVLVEFFNMADGRHLQARKVLELIDPDDRPHAILDPLIYATSTADFPDSLMTAKRSPLRQGVRLMPAKGDSLVTLRMNGKRHTLIMFTDQSSRRADSLSNLAAVLGNISGVRLVDISLDHDTISWRRSLPDAGQPDIPRYWALGGAAAPAISTLSVSRLPFFVVADSTSRILYRGPSVKAAQLAARR